MTCEGFFRSIFPWEATAAEFLRIFPAESGFNCAFWAKLTVALNGITKNKKKEIRFIFQI